MAYKLEHTEAALKLADHSTSNSAIAFNNSAEAIHHKVSTIIFSMQCYIVKNALLYTAFSAI